MSKNGELELNKEYVLKTLNKLSTALLNRETKSLIDALKMDNKPMYINEVVGVDKIENHKDYLADLCNRLKTEVKCVKDPEETAFHVIQYLATVLRVAPIYTLLELYTSEGDEFESELDKYLREAGLLK